MRTLTAFALSTLVAAAACGESSGGVVDSSPPADAPRLATVPAILLSGNPRCSDVLPGSREVKIEIEQFGAVPFNAGPVTITGLAFRTGETKPIGITFTSQIPIMGVVMKGSDAGNFYDYGANGTTGDAGLVTPVNSSTFNAAISHVSFCFVPKLAVTKTAATYADRDWTWTILKTADLSVVDPIMLGVSREVTYTVRVTGARTDTPTRIDGTITIANPAYNVDAATITGVADELAAGASATITGCTVGAASVGVPSAGSPYVLAAGGTMTCSYTAASWGGGTSGTNTATAATTGEVRGGSGTAPWSFAAATIEHETDECITARDDMGTPLVPGDDRALGQVCASGLSGGQHTFPTYRLDVRDLATTCGSNTITNTASFASNDTPDTGSSPHTVTVNVVCVTGCTLTQGYWKNHADPSRKQFDATWNLIPGAANASFMNTGVSWIQTFNTPPAGNAFYVLAHQYMAARLNVLAGAQASPTVLTAINNATALFAALPASGTALSSSQTRTARTLATTLDNFNNGLMGTPHCSE
jgi:hypothetical protein